MTGMVPGFSCVSCGSFWTAEAWGKECDMLLQLCRDGDCCVVPCMVAPSVAEEKGTYQDDQAHRPRV